MVFFMWLSIFLLVMFMIVNNAFFFWRPSFFDGRFTSLFCSYLHEYWSHHNEICGKIHPSMIFVLKKFSLLNRFSIHIKFKLVLQNNSWTYFFLFCVFFYFFFLRIGKTYNVWEDRVLWLFFVHGDSRLCCSILIQINLEIFAYDGFLSIQLRKYNVRAGVALARSWLTTRIGSQRQPWKIVKLIGRTWLCCY